MSRVGDQGDKGLSFPHPPAVPALQPSGRPPTGPLATAPDPGVTGIAPSTAPLHGSFSLQKYPHLSTTPSPDPAFSAPPWLPQVLSEAPPDLPLPPTHPALLLATSRPPPPGEAFQRDTSDRESKGIATGDGLRGSWRWHGDTESSKPAHNPSLSFRA